MFSARAKWKISRADLPGPSLPVPKRESASSGSLRKKKGSVFVCDEDLSKNLTVKSSSHMKEVQHIPAKLAQQEARGRWWTRRPAHTALPLSPAAFQPFFNTRGVGFFSLFSWTYIRVDRRRSQPSEPWYHTVVSFQDVRLKWNAVASKPRRRPLHAVLISLPFSFPHLAFFFLFFFSVKHVFQSENCKFREAKCCI